MTPPKNDEMVKSAIHDFYAVINGSTDVKHDCHVFIKKYGDLIYQLLEANRASQGEHEGWRDISTSKCDGGAVDLLLNGNARIPECYFDYYTKEWLTCGTDVPVIWHGDPVNKITHWMPIPALPVIGGGS